MPGYKEHMLGAVIAVGIVLFCCSLLGYYVPSPLVMQGLVFAMLGGIFPDIDTKSKGQKLVYLLICLATITCVLLKKYTAAIIIAVFAFLPLLANHRGLTHSLLFSVFVMTSLVTVCSFYSPSYTVCVVHNGIFFLVGVISHLFLDFGPRILFKRYR